MDTETPEKPIPQWVLPLSEELFPELDVALRSGKHIASEQIAWYTFLMEHYERLHAFYLRYRLELIHAKESFFYLRPMSDALIPRALLTPLEVLVGKAVCLLYLSPEKLKNEGIYEASEVSDLLFELSEPKKLLRLQRSRALGSDLDKEKFREKVRSALYRLKRLGMISFQKVEQSDPSLLHFSIHESIFRFAADVQGGLSLEEAQRKMISAGECVGLRPEEQEAGGNFHEETDPNDSEEALCHP